MLETDRTAGPSVTMMAHPQAMMMAHQHAKIGAPEWIVQAEPPPCELNQLGQRFSQVLHTDHSQAVKSENCLLHGVRGELLLPPMQVSRRVYSFRKSR